MNKFLSGIFIILTVLSSSVFAAKYEKVREQKLFNGETIEEYRLKNGFRVLVIPRHQAKVLTYQVWFKVGSVDEKLDPRLKKTGLAHLFEHMMFRGSEDYPDGKFDEITSRIGGHQQNATTYYYRTNYYESVPSKNLEQIMEIEADRMENLNLTTEIFEKEKGAVVGELRRALDNPSRLAWYKLLEELYKVAPYRFTVLGSEAEIKGFTLDEAKYFYKTFYAPNNATLIVAGDVEPKKLMELVHEYYGDMKTQSIPRPPAPVEPKQTKQRLNTFTHKQATSETLVLGYHIPSVNSPDIVPLSLLATHLSTGMESRLRKLLVDKGIAVRANAYTSGRPDIFEIFVQVAEKSNYKHALRVIDREIDSLQSRNISNASFKRALNQELLNLYGDINSNSELGNWLGEYLMLCDNYMRGFEIIEAYKSIKPKDLRRVAKQYLKKSNRAVVIVKPEAQKKE